MSKLDLTTSTLLTTICEVDEYGCFKPIFDLTSLGASEFSNLTSGQLKYFTFLKGKKLKLTLEIMEN